VYVVRPIFGCSSISWREATGKPIPNADEELFSFVPVESGAHLIVGSGSIRRVLQLAVAVAPRTRHGNETGLLQVDRDTRDVPCVQNARLFMRRQ
jgi:hypothetical protein